MFLIVRKIYLFLFRIHVNLWVYFYLHRTHVNLSVPQLYEMNKVTEKENVAS